MFAVVGYPRVEDKLEFQGWSGVGFILHGRRELSSTRR